MRCYTILILTLFSVVTHSCVTGGKNIWKDEKLSEGYRLEVLAGGQRLPVYEHRGRSYIEGQPGMRYVLHIHNDSPRLIEVVAAVDGRDVIDGKPKDPEKRGYIVQAWGTVVIDGWRTSMDTVAAFRFTSPEDSYSSRMGTPKEIGKIEVAVFREKEYPRRPLMQEGQPAGEVGAGYDGYPAEEVMAESIDMPESAGRRRTKPGNLGTQFGETHASSVQEVYFVRSGSRPDLWLGLRYDDAEGLCEKGLKDFCGPSTRPLQPVTNRRDSSFAEPPPGW